MTERLSSWLPPAWSTTSSSLTSAVRTPSFSQTPRLPFPPPYAILLTTSFHLLTPSSSLHRPHPQPPLLPSHTLARVDDERVYGFVRIETGDELSKRAKFALITWVGDNINAVKRAQVSTDKSFVKEIIKVPYDNLSPQPKH